MLKKFILAIFFALIIYPSNAHAISFMGMLSTDTVPAGLEGQGGIWPADFKIKWTIEQQLDGTWHYLYELCKTDGTALEKDISHVIIEASENTDRTNFWDFQVDGVDIENGDDDDDDDDKVEVKTYSPTDPGNSNPGLPGSFYGIKIDVGDGKSYSFYSDRAPVWGNFYAKSGRSGTGRPLPTDFNAIWNTDFLEFDPLDPPQDGLLSDGDGGSIYKILRPDTTLGIPPTTDPVVPEPSTILLLTLGLGAAGFRGLRSRFPRKGS